MGCSAAGTMGYQIPVTIGTHTGTSSLVMQAKLENTGSNKRLYIQTNVAQTSNTGTFGVPHLAVVARKWIT